MFEIGDAVELLIHSINDIKELGVVLDVRLNFVTLSFEYYVSLPSKTFWAVEHELINYELPEEKKVGYLKDIQDGI